MDWSFWNGKTVLVAGATGFLGGWLVRRLLHEHARPICIVRSDKPESQFAIGGFAKRTIVETGSLYDAEFVERVFNNHRIDVFFHAGYGADVNRVLQEPLECFRSTAESTWLCLDLIRRLQPSCVSVISSTDKAYGAQSLPYEELDALKPTHPYEVAKASQDLAAQCFGKIYGLPVAVTRCGNYFGGYDFNFTRLIPSVCKCLAVSERPVLRSDGRFTRDFLYIEDAVDAQLVVAEALAHEPSIYGEAFNFSYGTQLEAIDIVRRLTELAGQNVEPEIKNSTRFEIRDMRLSSKKAERILGWRSRCGFDEGLRRTLQWYSEYFRTKNTKIPFTMKPPIPSALLLLAFSSDLLMQSL